MDKTTFNRLVHLKLKETNPDLYDECMDIATAPLTDASLLPVIMEKLVDKYELSPDNIVFILATAYYLFAPHKLYSITIKLAVGMRTVISDGLGFNNAEMVNHHSKFILPFWKNRRFRERVSLAANEVLQSINIQ